MKKTGRHQGTYRGTFQGLVAVAGVAPFAILGGAATADNRKVILKKVTVSGLTLTAVEYLSLIATKYSSAASSGTSTDATAVPLDSLNAVAKATLKGYTGAPTAGTAVGTLASKRVLGQATTAAAAGIPQELVFEFDEDDAPVLNSVAEQIGFRFSSAPASAVTLNIEFEWVEESRNA